MGDENKIIAFAKLTVDRIYYIIRSTELMQKLFVNLVFFL